MQPVTVVCVYVDVTRSRMGVWISMVKNDQLGNFQSLTIYRVLSGEYKKLVSHYNIFLNRQINYVEK